MAGDGNAFTEICSVIESSQEVVWHNKTTTCLCMCSLACCCMCLITLCFACISVGNEITVCSKQNLICCSPICCMCNSDNLCNLHVCACGVTVCFVCSLCTFLRVIFWCRPLWIEAFFSHLLLSCWLSKAGESKQTPSTQQTEAVRPA